MGRICRALGMRCASLLWPLAAARLSRLRDRCPRELALQTRRRRAVQGRGVEARASSRAWCVDRAGRRVREWQGLTLIAQRPQRRGEQHNNTLYRAFVSPPGLFSPSGVAFFPDLRRSTQA